MKVGRASKKKKKFFLTVWPCVPGTNKNFSGKKSFPNAKKVLKKFLQALGGVIE